MLHTHRPTTAYKMRHTRGSVTQLNCKEFGCQRYAKGWRVVLGAIEQKDTIDWVKAGNTGRRFTVLNEQQGMVPFYFSPEQNCFEKHFSRLPLFDIGRVTTGQKTILYPDGDAFVEDSDNHLRKLKEVING